MTTRQITIAMSSATVEQLMLGGFRLYGWKAVKTTQSGAAPLVWFNTSRFTASTLVSWTDQYQAYTSNTTNLSPGMRIVPSFFTDIALGQTLNVGNGGFGSVVAGGVGGAISVNNTTTTQFTCGMNQMQNVNGSGAQSPLCALPLPGRLLDVFAPVEQVLLMFSSVALNTGTIINQAPSDGVLVDLTSNNQREVTFDINAGWSTNGLQDQLVRANSNLVPLLIQGP